MPEALPSRRRFLRTMSRCLALGAAAAFGGGCQLFDRSWISRFEQSKDDKKNRSVLPGVRRMPETVGLEIVFVERPIDDPLLSDENLWQGVDTVASIPAETHAELVKNGFRIGLASASANTALETMLGLTSQSSGATAPVDARKLVGRRVVRPTGGSTEVQTSRHFDTLTLPAKNPSDRNDEFVNARCVLRLKAERLQDGWARLEFLPEIHHGRLSWRPMATGSGWKGKTSQKIHRLFQQRFHLTLNTGELAVITAARRPADTLARHFFVDENAGQPVQRVLIVRLANVASNTPIAVNTEKR